jgi:hypothetical protein
LGHALPGTHPRHATLASVGLLAHSAHATHSAHTTLALHLAHTALALRLTHTALALHLTHTALARATHALAAFSALAGALSGHALFAHR